MKKKLTKNQKIAKRFFDKWFKEQYLKLDDFEVKAFVNILNKKDKQANGLERSSDKCHIQNVIKRNWAGIDEDIKFILGRPNFACGRIAARLRELGYECETKAEAEQALVIYVMLTYQDKYGKDWTDELNKYLKSG